MDEIEKVQAKTPDHSPFDELPKVVVAHLTFQTAISGEPSEGSLSYPIQSYLRVRKKTSWAAVAAEYDHPALKTDTRLGRPPQIDFVGKSNRHNQDGTQPLSFVLETKLHVSGSDWGRVVRDIVKLMLLADDMRDVAR